MWIIKVVQKNGLRFYFSNWASPEEPLFEPEMELAHRFSSHKDAAHTIGSFTKDEVSVVLRFELIRV